MNSSNESTAPTDRILKAVRAAVDASLSDDAGAASPGDAAHPGGVPAARPGGAGRESQVVLVGVSGGVDSAVALWAAAKAAPELRVVACHLDHGIRSAEEAQRDREAVEALAADLGVTVETDAVPRGLVEKRAPLEGGTEATARRFRYTFYERLADAYDACALILGHHRDDQVETVLVRLLSGNDPAALAGIPSMRPLASSSRCMILRPLLDFGKAEIRDAAAALALPLTEDATNRDMMFLRNRVRGQLMPELSAIAPDAPRRILATQRRGDLLRDMIESEIRDFPWRRRPASNADAREADAPNADDRDADVRADDRDAGAPEPPARSEETAERRSGQVRGDEPAILSAPLSAVAAVHPYLRLHLLVRAFGEVSREEGVRISERFLAPLLRRDLADMAGFTATAFGVTVTVSGEEISLRPEEPAEEGEGYLFALPPLRTADGSVPESLVLEGRCGHRRYRLALAGEDVAEPVVVRSRRPGDVLVRAGGSRRVKRILIDIGVPKGERQAVPIVEDREGVVAVIGSAVGREDVLRRGVRHGQLSRDHVIFQMESGIR